MTEEDSVSTIPDGEKYIRPYDVARMTGVSIQTVRRAISSHDLKSYRVGDAIVIQVNDVHQWIQGRVWNEK